MKVKELQDYTAKFCKTKCCYDKYDCHSYSEIYGQGCMVEEFSKWLVEKINSKKGQINDLRILPVK